LGEARRESSADQHSGGGIVVAATHSVLPETLLEISLPSASAPKVSAAPMIAHANAYSAAAAPDWFDNMVRNRNIKTSPIYGRQVRRTHVT
jgi:hypothetical protein